MNEVWVLTYEVSERRGHGEGSTGHTAIWDDAGFFKCEADAKRWIKDHPRAGAWFVSGELKPLKLQISK